MHLIDDIIKEYVIVRGMKWPDPLNAFLFALTEIGEVMEQEIHPVEGDSLGFEVGDVFQMSNIACYGWCHVTSDDISFLDRRDIISVKEIYIQMSRILDAYLRLDGTWVRNNDKSLSMEQLFAQFFIMLYKYSLQETGKTPKVHMLEKMKSKGVIFDGVNYG